MRFFAPPSLLQYAYPRGTLWKVNTNKKQIYLTFDDGPSPGITDPILDLLKEFNAKATFFLIGKKVETFPGLYKKIVNQGHSTGNHTYNHADAWKVGATEFLAEIEKCNQVFQSPWFRPPYGRLPFFTPQFISKNYRIIMWSLLSYDFDELLRPEDIIPVFKKRTTPGSIWVFHDNEKSKDLSVRVLPKLLAYFSEEGYQFCSLDEAGI